METIQEAGPRCFFFLNYCSQVNFLFIYYTFRFIKFDFYLAVTNFADTLYPHIYMPSYFTTKRNQFFLLGPKLLAPSDHYVLVVV